jgi:protein-S-isoprenylcysteine O-methyltransferase Ste14
MSRSTLALVVCVIWGLTAFGLRMLIQLRRTGDSGFRTQTTEFGSAEWWARVLFVVALELQVRVVEEPYLRSVHGENFVRYTSRVGRFLPGIGRTA